jgi:hypothetical protein
MFPDRYDAADGPRLRVPVHDPFDRDPMFPDRYDAADGPRVRHHRDARFDPNFRSDYQSSAVEHTVAAALSDNDFWRDDDEVSPANDFLPGGNTPPPDDVHDDDDSSDDLDDSDQVDDDSSDDLADDSSDEE